MKEVSQPSRRCYARMLGNCSSGISREHYISRSVLAEVGDTIWMEGSTVTPAGSYRPSALTAKILCGAHNSQLSPLDHEAVNAFRKLRELQTKLDRGAAPSLSGTDSINGSSLELWLLKLALGMLAVRQMRRVDLNEPIPTTRRGYERRLLNILFHGEAWPERWGMYVDTVPGRPFAAPVTADGSTAEVGVETLMNPTDASLMGSRTWFRSFGLLLAFGKPDQLPVGAYRPGGLRLRRAGRVESHTLLLTWKSDGYPHHVIDFVRVGELE
jgi:hypothetical protein